MIRDYVATLVGGLQCTAAKAMVVVLLLAHHLPQPWPQCDTTSQARSRGRNFALDIMAGLDETFMANPVQDLHERPSGVQETVPLLPALSPLTMEIITFLEDADYLLDNTSVDDANDDAQEEIQDSLDRDVIQAMVESRAVQDTGLPAPTSTTQYGGSTCSTVCPPTTGRTTSTSHDSMAPATMRAGTASTQGSLTGGISSTSGTLSTTPGTGSSATPGIGSLAATSIPPTSGTSARTSSTVETDNDMGKPRDTAQEGSKTPSTSPKRKRKQPVPDAEGIRRFMKDGGSTTEREG